MDYNKLLKNITKQEAEKALQAIYRIQEIDTKYSKSYFWRPARNAAQRRTREFTEEINFTLNGNEFAYDCEYTESCQHCYFSKTILLNDEQITMRTINTLGKKLCDFI